MMILAYGAGTDSTAILVGMYEKGMSPPDLILFADTGGEKPHTIKFLTTINNWLLSIGWPQVITVRKVYRGGKVANLYDHSYERRMLPSLAYGFKNCSQKFKHQPQDKYCNNYEPFKAHWKAGKKVTKVIGYDMDEAERAAGAPENDKKYTFWYPLIEWEWDREDCKAAIARAGLPQPGKSACYFCPSSTLGEIRQLNEMYPQLAEKALELEANADLTSVKGLGRRFAWRDVLAQPDIFNGFMPEIQKPCGCHD